MPTFRTTRLKVNTDSPRLHEIIESLINGTDQWWQNRGRAEGAFAPSLFGVGATNVNCPPHFSDLENF